MAIFDNLKQKALELLIRQIPNFMTGSWRTSLVAYLGAAAIILTQFVNLLDADPNTVFSIEAIMTAAAIFGIGKLARDKKVSSEEAGAQ